MYFDSFSALVHMDGHGVYVWTVYAIAMVVVLYQVISPIARARNFWRRELALYKRLQRRPDAEAGRGQ